MILTSLPVLIRTPFSFLILLGTFLWASAEESFEIQKTPKGELQINKMILKSAPPSSDELKIEILSPPTLNNPHDLPQIETESPAVPRPSIDLSSLSFFQKITAEPIQITIQNGVAFVHWSGGDQTIPLDSLGRFNLQFSPAPADLKKP